MQYYSVMERVVNKFLQNKKKHEAPHYAIFSSPLLLPPSQAQVLSLAPADPQTQDQH